MNEARKLLMGDDVEEDDKVWIDSSKDKPYLFIFNNYYAFHLNIFRYKVWRLNRGAADKLVRKGTTILCILTF